MGYSKEWRESGNTYIKNVHRGVWKHQVSKRHIFKWKYYHFLGKHWIKYALSEVAWLQLSSTVKWKVIIDNI